MDPNFTKNVKQFYIMGSSINQTESMKNEGLEIEFNFQLDPESNIEFFNSTMNNLPVITTLNVVEDNPISKVLTLF